MSSTQLIMINYPVYLNKFVVQRYFPISWYILDVHLKSFKMNHLLFLNNRTVQKIHGNLKLYPFRIKKLFIFCMLCFIIVILFDIINQHSRMMLMSKVLNIRSLQ